VLIFVPGQRIYVAFIRSAQEELRDIELSKDAPMRRKGSLS
jgi:hypothetical protein